MSNHENIRPAKTDRDKKAILELLRKGFGKEDLKFAERYYDNFFKDDTVTSEDEVFVAELNNEIVGVIGYSCDYFSTNYSYWVGWLMVLEKFREKKIGSALLGTVESELKAYEVKKLFVSADDKNETAISFYIKNGFSFEARLRDYYYSGEDQIILGKNL